MNLSCLFVHFIDVTVGMGLPLWNKSSNQVLAFVRGIFSKQNANTLPYYLVLLLVTEERKVKERQIT